VQWINNWSHSLHFTLYIVVWREEIVTFLHSECDVGSFLLCEQETDKCNFFFIRCLRSITGAPWYVSNKTLHEHLNIPFITDVIKQRANRYRSRLSGHGNQLIADLSKPHANEKMYHPWMIGDRAVSGMNEFEGKPKYSEEPCPNAALSTTDPTWLHPGHCGWKAAKNRRSCGTAFLKNSSCLISVLLVRMSVLVVEYLGWNLREECRLLGCYASWLL
jgi:hypothetical protein